MLGTNTLICDISHFWGEAAATSIKMGMMGRRPAPAHNQRRVAACQFSVRLLPRLNRVHGDTAQLLFFFWVYFACPCRSTVFISCVLLLGVRYSRDEIACFPISFIASYSKYKKRAKALLCCAIKGNVRKFVYLCAITTDDIFCLSRHK